MTETWEPELRSAGATRPLSCRTRVDRAAAGDVVPAHAAPPPSRVTVRDEPGGVRASGEVERGEPGPIGRPRREVLDRATGA